MLRALRRQEERRKRVWVSEAFQLEQRMLHGASESYIETIRRTDPNRYYNFMRMSPQIFDLLLSIVGPVITKQRAVREPISAKCRLEITVRYLATGDNYETLAALFRCLKPLVFQDPDEEFWLERAEEFAWEWDFEHCVGGIDSKLITIQAPPNSGSLMYDYKGHHSFHLHAILDAYQKFIMVDVGAAGRQSDGGVFRNSRMGQLFIRNLMNLPAATPLVEGGPEMPYCLVGDEAFGLSPFMMRPYPRCRTCNLRQSVFNYRLSRARRIAECGFGSFTQVWRVCRSQMDTSMQVSIQAIHACTCLHNFLIMNEEKRFRRRRRAEDRNQLHEYQYEPEEEEEPRVGSVERIRYNFSRHFVGAGAIDCQWEKARRGDF